MKKSILFFIFLLILSCNSSNTTKKNVIINDLDKDFPITDTLTFNKIQKFEIITQIIANFYIKDSFMFIVEQNRDNYGHSYNINNGEKLSALVGQGRAHNEMSRIPLNGVLVGDSIQFTEKNIKSIKTFSIKDILTKPMGDRYCSEIKLPDSVGSDSYIKIDHNKMFGTCIKRSNNNVKFFLYDGKQTSFIEKIGRETFDPDMSDEEVAQLKKAADIIFCTDNKNRVVAANYNEFLLEVIDINNRKTDYERGYFRMSNRKNPSGFNIAQVSCNEENIYCFVQKKVNEKQDKGNEIYEHFIFVFDWQLNPVKKYYSSINNIYKSGRIAFSEDSKSFYYLGLRDEEQDLWEAKIVL